MARGDDGRETIADGSIKGEIRREDCRLAELRLTQLLFGADALQAKEVVTENRRRSLEDFASGGSVCRNVGSHTDALRTLPGKDCGNAHYATHRHATAPHDRPPPNATKTIRSPGLIRPARTVSESAIGIDAAEVLPYSAMLTTTFSSGSRGSAPSRR